MNKLPVVAVEHPPLDLEFVRQNTFEDELGKQIIGREKNLTVDGSEHFKNGHVKPEPSEGLLEGTNSNKSYNHHQKTRVMNPANLK